MAGGAAPRRFEGKYDGDRGAPPRRHRVWQLDACGEVAHHTHEPLGYIPGNFEAAAEEVATKKERDDKNELVKKSAWTTAIAPGGQIFMTAFMLWMSGNSLQIFSIMMLGMAFWNPLKAIFSVGQVFKRYEDSPVDLNLEKLVYVALNMCGVALALWKCNSMGLLPTGAASGAAAAASMRSVREFSSGGVVA